MKFLDIQEFVIEAAAEAKLADCKRCNRTAQKVGLLGRPTLTTLARKGTGIEEIEEAIAERGWYCRKCSNNLRGNTTATTLRDKFPPGEEGYAAYNDEIFWRAYPEKRERPDPTNGFMDAWRPPVGY